MAGTLGTTQLHKWLKSKDEALAARVLHIRAELSKWLPKIDQFFPHYPSHGIDHSDRIVEQLSRMLFAKTRPVVQFSTAEVYCLLCAAYLHDMGMVVSPGEASEILASDEWKEFAGPGGKGRESFEKYVALRDGPMLSTREQTAFFANQSLRYLIADFVRRRHHERGKMVLEMHPFLRQLVDDGDSVAFETIADIGVAHGLSDREVSDQSRFPEERDVFDGKVNVRFLARLLRIGDLLDVSTRRADPMTARAIGPLPGDAVPHWQQYASKRHENITPTKLEFTFECKDQDAHRVLRDWFAWLEVEVRTAGLEQLHSPRHDNWKAPLCTVNSQASVEALNKNHNATVVLRPEKGAHYVFHDWKLQLDLAAVLQLLIRDVYNNPTVFLRELIQNALDATRCQMYADFALAHGHDNVPERSTQFPDEFRERYRVSVSLTEEEVKLTPDGPIEARPVFTVEDRGTGMSEDIVQRYFLQIGRSYYQSYEFRKQYKFAPTSQFGIGFLSVFAVSNDVTVDTARRDDDTGRIKGIRLRLREPRNYLLTQPWDPFQERAAGERTGTRIRVVLEKWPAKEIAKIVRTWFIATEVPICVTEAGHQTIIRRDRLADMTVLATGRLNPAARFVLRTFDLDSGGVEGQIAVIAYQDSAGEGWCDCWPDERDLGGNRLDSLPNLTVDYAALHGVRFGDSCVDIPGLYLSSQWVQQCDVRSRMAKLPVARWGPPNQGEFDDGSHRSDACQIAAAAVNATARAAVEHHCANSARARGNEAPYYIGKVLALAPLDRTWREGYPGTVVTWQNGRRRDISVKELLALNEVAIAAWLLPYSTRGQRHSMPTSHPKDTSSNVPVVSWSDTPAFSHDAFRKRLSAMNLVGVVSSGDLWLLKFSAANAIDGWYLAHPRSTSWVVPLPLQGLGALRCEFLGSAGNYLHLLAAEHAAIKWLSHLTEIAKRPGSPVQAVDIEAFWYIAADQPYFVRDWLEKWDRSPSVPPELKPPKSKDGRLVDFSYSELSSVRTLAMRE